MTAPLDARQSGSTPEDARLFVPSLHEALLLPANFKERLKSIDLDGRVAIVTGGTKGIGREIVRTLARQGASVVFNARNLGDAEQIGQEAAELSGHDSLFVPGDISDPTVPTQIAKTTIDHFGRVDILVNNAGISGADMLVRQSDEEWDQVMDVKVTGAKNMTRAVIRQMQKQKSGSIINVSSVMGQMGEAALTAYSTANAALIGFTKAVAAEYGSRDIRSNALAFGWVETDMTEPFKGQAERIRAMTPNGKFVAVEDAANAVLFLASDMSSAVNGAVLNANNGVYR